MYGSRPHAQVAGLLRELPGLRHFMSERGRRLESGVISSDGMASRRTPLPAAAGIVLL
jgi:hypothetical protein